MRALLGTAVVLALSLAGCDIPDLGADSTPGRSSASATATLAPQPLSAALSADVANGTAPLVVNFTLEAFPGATSWRLSFGDGGVSNGTGLPGPATHTYVAAGNFTALLSVSLEGSNATANVTITVGLPAGPAGPDVTHFEFDESLGCGGEDGAGTDACLSFIGGPDASGIDGYWQALDERYWGLTFTSTVTQGGPVAGLLNDSDCAFTDADHKIIGFANNSTNPCAGVVPEGTAFIFLFPFLAPAAGMTLDFTTG